jgi:hypothetical protein
LGRLCLKVHHWLGGGWVPHAWCRCWRCHWTRSQARCHQQAALQGSALHRAGLHVLAGSPARPHPERHLCALAAGEAEHAAIGHSAVLNLVPAAHEPIMRQAMADHDRDMAAFYNVVADMLAA